MTRIIRHVPVLSMVVFLALVAKPVFGQDPGSALGTSVQTTLTKPGSNAAVKARTVPARLVPAIEVTAEFGGLRYCPGKHQTAVRVLEAPCKHEVVRAQHIAASVQDIFRCL
jgi:hypothetical protein